MRSLLKKLVLASAMMLCVFNLFADEKGLQIMTEVADFKEPKFTRSQVIMTIEDANGSQEKRQIIEYGKNQDGKTYMVMDFKTPASVKGTRFMQITDDNGPDNKWIYLPSLKSVRRVNSSEGSKSFMGTDATYDDMASREVSEDEHTFVKEEHYTVESGVTYDCYVVKSVPNDKKSSQYSYRIVWVDKTSMYPVHTELYDKAGKLVKVLEVLSIDNIQGYYIPLTDKLTNVQTGHSTSIEIVKIEIDKAIPERIFTQNFLSTGK